MGNRLKFTISRKKRRWRCPKDVTLCIDSASHETIKKTRKKSRVIKNTLRQMDCSKKKKLLEKQGVIKENSKAPEDLVDIIIKAMI